MPAIEDALFILLIVFSLTFGACLYGIGERLKSESTEPAISAKSIPSKLERDIKKLVLKHPIEGMAPFIAKQDKIVAAYLVAIAKKESNWGKYSPKKDGKECYNYWGYRGTYNQTQSGYSCFDSPSQAVDVVGDRIGELIDQNIDTPREMIVWKCGRSCYTHSSYSVDKWIKDVDLYYRKL